MRDTEKDYERLLASMTPDQRHSMEERHRRFDVTFPVLAEGVLDLRVLHRAQHNLVLNRLSAQLHETLGIPLDSDEALKQEALSMNGVGFKIPSADNQTDQDTVKGIAIGIESTPSSNRGDLHLKLVAEAYSYSTAPEEGFRTRFFSMPISPAAIAPKGDLDTLIDTTIRIGRKISEDQGLMNWVAEADTDKSRRHDLTVALTRSATRISYENGPKTPRYLPRRVMKRLERA